MKHLIKGRQFKRNKSQREALLGHIARAVILNGKIITTSAKAKETAPYLEKLITAAKKQDLSSAKKIHSIFDNEISKKLIKEIAPRYQGRKGGYSRITKIGFRQGDQAEMAMLELV